MKNIYIISQVSLMMIFIGIIFLICECRNGLLKANSFACLHVIAVHDLRRLYIV